MAGLSLKIALGALGPNATLGSTELALGVTPIEGIALEVTGTFVLTLSVLLASSYIRSRYSRPYWSAAPFSFSF